MTNPERPIAREALYEIIENQMRDLTPPATKQTYDRLRADGNSNEETMKLISCVLISELSDMIKGQEFFNEVRYVAALNALPEIPWDDAE